MSASSGRKEGLGLLGLGAAACVACCAGPILAFLGGMTLAGLASMFVIGVVGLVVAAIAVVGFVVVRRRRKCSTPTDGPVAVARQPSRLRRTRAVP